MLDSIDSKGIEYVPARMATHEEIAMIHSPSYIESIAATKGKIQTRLDPDTVASPKSYEAACMAVGGVLNLADKLMENGVENGFALVRPPGHHAEHSRAMGFCIFNNIAVAARYLTKKHGLKKIIIVDFDLHHGNGTQHSFYTDYDVMYFSTHQYPYYPGTGHFDEVGEGEGKGYTVNVPLSYGMDDADYMYVFKNLLMPIADLFKPEAILVSAGFDTHHNDPLGGMGVTEAGYASMTRILMDIAKKHSQGRLLFCLEGGYDINGLTNSVKAVIQEMKGTSIYGTKDLGSPCDGVIETVKRVKKALLPYWGEF
jgi:acetoin utilization deacetylase AcuC-like enzyme